MRKPRPGQNTASPRARLGHLPQGSAYGGVATCGIADPVRLDTDYSPPQQQGQSRGEGCSLLPFPGIRVSLQNGGPKGRKAWGCPGTALLSPPPSPRWARP